MVGLLRGCRETLADSNQRQREFYLHSVLRRTPSSAARAFDGDAFSCAKTSTEFSRLEFEFAVEPSDGCFSHGSSRAATQSPGAAYAAIGKKRDIAIGEHFDFAND